MSRRNCGYCHESGHNRSTCPTEKARVESIRETRPESWTVAEYDRRQERRKETRARAVASRTCTYCGDAGHNRRSCSTLKDHLHRAHTANRIARADILRYMREQGIGVGAMMALSERVLNEEKNTYEYQVVPHLVTKVDWKTIDVMYFSQGKLESMEQPLTLQNLHTGRKCIENLIDEGNMKQKIESLKACLADGTSIGGIYSPVVISPAPTVNPPMGWRSSRKGTSSLEARFKDKKMQSYNFREGWAWEDVRDATKES